MRTNDLNQVLLVEPKCTFETIDKALSQLGWLREQRDLAAPPLVANEPEVATWTWQGHKPFVIYTFNPVVKMRVLDVATLPPAMRGALAEQLPIMDEDAVSKLFESDDVRERLLALWAAQETERLDLIKDAERLTGDGEKVLADEARQVHERLLRINEARHELLVNLRLMSETAPKLIRRMVDPAFVQTLKPGREELQQLFDESLLPAAEKASEAIYRQQKLRVSALEYNSEIQVFACPAGLLRWQNMLSEKLPGGYREIAGWMNPKCLWLAWSVSTPQGGTVRYDGLAWVNCRWCWLPKIFRYLRPYLLDPSTPSIHRH